MNKTRCIALALALALPGAQAHAQVACASLTINAAAAAVAQARARGAACGSRGGFGAAAPLRWSPTLDRVAREQALWVMESGRLTHAGRDGQSLGQRAATAGYRYARIAENLAQGQEDLAEVMAAWAASDGHCANLHDAGVSVMALACRPAADGQPIWVLVLARPLVAAAPGPAR